MLSFISASIKSTMSVYSALASMLALTVGVPLFIISIFGTGTLISSSKTTATTYADASSSMSVNDSAPISSIKKDKLKIYIAHSYTFTHACTGPQRNGILKSLSSLEDKYDLIIHESFMDTKVKYRTASQMSYIGNIINEQINNFKPDYILTTDDNAFYYVGIPSLIFGYNVIASGLNRSIKDYTNEMNTQNTKVPWNHLIAIQESIDLVPLFNLFNQCRFKPNNYYIIYDDSETSYYLLKEYEKFFENKKVDTYQIRSVVELRKLLAKIQSDPQGVIIIALQRLYDVDANNYSGGYIDKEQLFSEFKSFNTRHLELVANPIFTQFGFALSCGPDFYDMGTMAGDELVKSVRTKQFNAQILNPKMIINANGARLEKLGLQGISSGGFHLIHYIYTSYK